MVNLQLAATYSCRGEAKLTLAAATRSEDISRQFGLASLPMSLALQAVAHGFSGNWAAMQAHLTEARATGSDGQTVDMATLGNGLALYHLGEGQVSEAMRALDQAMDVLGEAATRPTRFPADRALLRTVCDEGGAERRDRMPGARIRHGNGPSHVVGSRCRCCGSRRRGCDLCVRFGGSSPQRFRRWIPPQSCPASGRSLRFCGRMGAAGCLATGRRSREILNSSICPISQASAVWRYGPWESPFHGRLRARRREPGHLAGRGVTPREAEVLAQLGFGRSNRDIAEAMHLSVRTVEKHVERLVMKMGHSRTELARLAGDVEAQRTG